MTECEMEGFRQRGHGKVQTKVGHERGGMMGQ